MQQRQASSYGRRFLYGRQRPMSYELDLETIWSAPGIGLVPPEFDDIEGEEQTTIEHLRAEQSIPR